MAMSPDNNVEGICSVTELAKKLNLSRARLYQHMKMGVFPMPVYCIRTKRPFYPSELQQKCLAIYKAGFGLNEQPVIFYTPRKKNATKFHQKTGTKPVISLKTCVQDHKSSPF